ncbi:DevR family CRISPR-associated autoregulator [Vulcanisaeta distributa]|uniref:CRISPR-associated autoregulator, DevR family n=1 Tax=Vulcanisaeta distributa (strain DSM 14429 / JCM 11212 / NBRC 100878 / IC-017) TaxID=572478 RepID=E1QU73_VULDI|nr:DevR family CRISPR-associated autoregulator [Vulcanisaeta distributa]ADN51067.1 CRISPR-associated autoregulator, DevR family [Vulcanisaeta distributa DSM 14429]
MSLQTNQSERPIFFSMSMRFIAAVEHANMIGIIPGSNITKHRFIHVPVLIKSEDGNVRFKLVKVPSISGQAVLNAYERALVDYAVKAGLPIDDVCKQYNFIKHANDENGSEDDWIKNCLVDDLTGYLAPKVNLKKTSAVWFSYVVPDLTIGKALLDYQMFTRFTPEAKKGEQFVGERESGHAVYRLSVAINVNSIGRSGKGDLVIGDKNARKERIEAAFKALMLMFNGGYIGANKTRALMTEYVKPTSLVASVSVGLPFMVSPAEGYDYIVNTYERAKIFVNKLGTDIKVYLYYLASNDAEEPKDCRSDNQKSQTIQSSPQDGGKLQCESVSTLNEAIEKALDKVLEEMGFGGNGGS